MREYGKNGNREVVNFYLNLSPDYQSAAEGALEGGHIDLFRDLLVKAPLNYPWGWTNLGIAVGKSGNKEIVGAFSLISMMYGTYVPRLFVDILRGDMRSGNKQLLDYIRSLIPSNFAINWSSLLHDAILSNNKEFFDYVRALVPPNNVEITIEDLTEPSLAGNIPFFDHIRSLLSPAQRQDEPWQYYANDALVSGKRAMFDHVRSLAPVDYDWQWDQLPESALESGNRYLFDYIRNLLLSLMPDYEWNWEGLLKGAIFSRNRKLVDYIETLAPQNYYLN